VCSLQKIDASLGAGWSCIGRQTIAGSCGKSGLYPIFHCCLHIGHSWISDYHFVSNPINILAKLLNFICSFRNGVQIHYEGERRKEDMVNFADKCAGPVVDKIQSQAQFTEVLL